MEGSSQDRVSSQLRGRDYVRSQLDRPRLSSPYRQQIKDDFGYERPEGMYFNHAQGKYVDNPPWLPQPRGGDARSTLLVTNGAEGTGSSWI